MDKAREYLADEPFFLLMPDNVFYGETSACVQLRDAFVQHPRNILGLTEITRETAEGFSDSGGVELEPLADRLFRVTGLLDKSRSALDLGATDRALRACGRYILTAEFFHEAQRIAPDQLTRMDEVPVLRRLVENGKVLGLALDGTLFECGNWQGYWAANGAWMRRKGVGGEL
jgi:UTP--glucose-1-phosphate uridylyltransferase